MNLRSASTTKVVGFLGLLLLAGLGWVVAVGPQTRALAEIRTQIDDSRAQNVVLGNELAQLQEQAGTLGDIRTRARRLGAMFPPTANQPEMFRQVTQAAVQAGIGPRHVTALTPTPPTVGSAPGTGVQVATPTTGAGLATQTVTVSVEGSYDQTQRLLENLEHMPRAFLVTSVTLGAGTTSGTYTTTVMGTMFVMPPAADPGDVAVTSAPSAK